jgi:hypothetical protein
LVQNLTLSRSHETKKLFNFLSPSIYSTGGSSERRTPCQRDGNYKIAVELLISEQTVKTHVSNILSKLHLADRTQAAIYALQKRLIPLDEALE